MEIDCGTDILFTAEENISVYDSSEWAERGFCKQCGTHLFYRLKGIGEYQVPVGVFDSNDGLIFDQQVFIDKRPEFYHFSEKTQNMTSAEVFAKYGSPD